ncbi:MAG: DUF4296 domain-containing protein [Saprospiraceae bacterium]
MGRLKILILIFCGSLTLLSCQEEAIKPQISDEKMVKILTDLHISEAAILSLNQKIKDSISIVYYQQIFEIHGVTDSVFYKDLETLRGDAKKLEEIYIKVLDNIEVLDVKKVEEVKKDSIETSSKKNK